MWTSCTHPVATTFCPTGSWARKLPQIERNRHVEEQARLDAEFFRLYDKHEAARPLPGSPRAVSVDSHLLWLWSDFEWRGWEEEAPWQWQVGGCCFRMWRGEAHVV